MSQDSQSLDSVEWIKSLNNIPKNAKEKIISVLNSFEIDLAGLKDFTSKEDFIDQLDMDKPIAAILWKHWKPYKEASNDIECNNNGKVEPGAYDRTFDDATMKGTNGINDENDDINYSGNVDTTLTTHVHNDEKQNEKSEFENDTKQEKLRKGRMIGIKNLGNTCFMNSALQCLLHTPGFTNVLLDQIEKAKEMHDQDENENATKFAVKQEKKQKAAIEKHKKAEIKRIEALKQAEIKKQKESKKAERRKWLKELDIGCSIKLKIRDYVDNKSHNKELQWVDAQVTKINRNAIVVSYWTKSNRVASVVKQKNSTEIQPINFQEQLLNNSEHENTDVNTGNTVDTSSDSQKSWTDSIKDYGQYALSFLPFQTTEYEKQPFKIRRDDFYYEWLHVLREVHLKNKESNNKHVDTYSNNYNYNYNYNYNSNRRGYNNNKYGDSDCLTPSKLHGFVRRENSKFGNYAQNDAGQALLVILKGIEDKLPSSITSESICDVDVPLSIFDLDDKWPLSQDKRMVSNLQNDDGLNIKKNLVSEYFDGIEVTEQTCMNCGFQRRIYKQTRGMEIPIIEEYIELPIYFCEYINATNNTNLNIEPVSKLKVLELPKDCTVELAKFFVLLQNNGGKTRHGLCNEIKRYELVKLNTLNGRFNLSNSGEILDNNDLIKQHIKNEYTKICMAPVCVINNRDNNNNTRNQHQYNKVLCIQIKPDQFQHKSSMPFSISVLYVKSNMSHDWMKSQLIASNFGFFESKYQKNMISDKFKLIVYCNGTRIENDNQYYTFLNKNNRSKTTNVTFTNTIVCFWEPNINFINSDDIKEQTDGNDDTKKTVFKALKYVFENDFFRKTNDKTFEEKIKYLENEKRFAMIEAKDLSVTNDVYNILKSGGNKNLNFGMKLKIETCNDLIKMVKNTQIRDENAIKMVKSAISDTWKSHKKSVVYKASLHDIEDCLKLYEKQTYERSKEFEVPCPNCTYAPIIRICKKPVIMPNILFIKLKRGGTTRNKISHNVNFTDILHYGDDGSCMYSLYGISIHSGSNEGGHYTAYVRRLGTETWYNCNDTFYKKSNNYECHNAIFMVFSKIQ